MIGTLYIVATPIGNMNDISMRALEILGSVDLVLAEDTRVTRKLFARHKIDTQLKSYHHYSGEGRKLGILKSLIEGKDLALVSDAGTPGISDPGNELVDYLLGREPRISIVPIPGPSALAAALSVCGFDVNKFTFLGFFPKKKRQKLIRKMSESNVAQVFHESPHRLLRTLNELGEALGDDNRRVFVGRELTKLHETIYRGTFDKVIKQLEGNRIRGEVVVVVEKNKS